MAVLTLDEAKAQLNIPEGDLSLDDELNAYIASVDEVIERQTRKVVHTRSVTERHHVQRRDTLVLHRRPVSTLTSVTRIDGSQTWDLIGLDVDQGAGVVRVMHGPPFDGVLKVEYVAGFATEEIPDNFRLAARIILQHLWETQRSRFGSPRVGGMEGTPGRGYAVPNAALQLLGHPGPTFA